MRKLSSPVLLISGCLLSTSVLAGWSDVLNEAKKTGGAVLQQSSGSSTSSKNGQLDNSTLINGLKESLSVGAERAIKTVSAKGGYLNDAKIRVPMPGALQSLASPLRKFGMGKQVDQFEESINRAAERAAPQAASIIGDSIKSMSFEDARKIYSGADDAATQYFKQKTGARIAELFRPEIDSALGEVGATRYYNDLAKQASSLPLVGKDVNTDLTSHVTNAALDGLFLKLAAEEKAIRNNPVARSTDLLKTLWGK
jgi:hypothetical protein